MKYKFIELGTMIDSTVLNNISFRLVPLSHETRDVNVSV